MRCSLEVHIKDEKTNEVDQFFDDLTTLVNQYENPEHRKEEIECSRAALQAFYGKIEVSEGKFMTAVEELEEKGEKYADEVIEALETKLLRIKKGVMTDIRFKKFT